MSLQGQLDAVRRNSISGWVLDSATPDAPVSLLITVNGAVIARVMANRYRADLERAGKGDGRHSFQFALLPALSPTMRHVIEVRGEISGAHIPGSPRVLEPETDFTEEVKGWIAAALGNGDSDAGLAERLDFLTKQTESLLQRRATLRGQAAPQDSALRWSAQQPTAGIPPAAVVRPLRALVIDERMPASQRDAGSNAITSHMLSLQRLGYEVSLATAEVVAPSSEVEALGIRCCGLPWYASVEELLRREAGGFDLVYLHRLSVATRYTPLARHYQRRARIVFSVADLHHLRLERQAEVEQRPELRKMAQRMQLTELLAISAVDAVITHSTHEAQLLERQAPRARVHVVPWALEPRPAAAPFAARRGMAFIGGYAHRPNLDAAQWLIDEIVPLLRARDPQFECLLVGSEMPEGLGRGCPGVVAVGPVQNLAEVFERVRLTVAPLTYGAGIKGKLLDSIAAGIPCVGTAVAYEGLDLPELLIAQGGGNARELADAILRLHDDAQLNARVSEAGLGYVRERLSQTAIDSLMRKAAGLPEAVPAPAR